MVFWFGDLNFRIEDYDIHVVKCAIDSNKLPLLWERDQVRPPVHLCIFLEGFVATVCQVINANRGCQRKEMNKNLLLSELQPVFLSSSVVCVLISSTWLKTQSPSWKASSRAHSIFHPLISLMWALTHMTLGQSKLIHINPLISLFLDFI